MAATNKTLVFSAVVCGFHICRDVWSQHVNEVLVCLLQANNLFNMFAARACRKDCEKTVGHLPREISCPTKYLIDREAKITVKLSSINYRKSRLFQGNLVNWQSSFQLALKVICWCNFAFKDRSETLFDSLKLLHLTSPDVRCSCKRCLI